ncbi:MAG: hypothetical protein AMXMBFR82_34090 [Candidatus Hydrogenedentota bacterium]
MGTSAFAVSSGYLGDLDGDAQATGAGRRVARQRHGFDILEGSVQVCVGQGVPVGTRVVCRAIPQAHRIPGRDAFRLRNV